MNIGNFLDQILFTLESFFQEIGVYIGSLNFSKIGDILLYNQREPLLFSSGAFLFIFLLFMIGYYCLRNKVDKRLLFITLFSYYFFYKSSGFYFFLLFIVTVSDFYIAKRIANRQYAKLWLALSLLIDLGLLAYFKYTNFFVGMVAQMIGNNFQPWDIFLPVGISFYTFKTISYVVDVYRGKIQPMDKLLDYAFYVSFFPTLLAGPITRATDFGPQIRKPLHISREMFAWGVFFIITGLFKKAVISDYISQNFVDRIFDNPTLFSGGEVLLGLYGYCIQIYCDFSGYSDMAIGIALLLGFKIPMNFNAPLTADSMTDFWRRWHISLSTWIRDYVYISLGGNRKGTLHMYLNQMIAMTACGLWHGASLNFIVWGVLHGALVCLHKFWSQTVMKHDKHYHPTGLRRFFSVFITFHVLCFTWLLFRCKDFEGVGVMIKQMFTKFNPSVLPDVVVGYKYVFLLMAFALLTHWIPDSWQRNCVNVLQKGGVLLSAIAITIVIFIIMQVKSSDIQPFIYFQF
ncbi:MAG: MBOAT family O-acyltransferase [Prevotella histicola]|jgi:alginate O-acetyltransferase algI